MKKISAMLFILIMPVVVLSQDMRIYGFLPSSSPIQDYVSLAELDPRTGSVITVDSIRPINAYALGSSTFNSFNQTFTFVGVDTSMIFRLVSWGVNIDSMLWAPQFGETINDLQHDMNSLQVYGLGNYLVNPLTMQYGLRFLEIDQLSGEITELSKMPEATAFPAGASTFDSNNGRYIISIIDTNLTGRLYAIEARTGIVLSDTTFSLPSNTDILNLEYNNQDNKVYGLFRNVIDNFFAIASIDLPTASIVDTVYVINDLQYFVQGASVFHQMTQNYIFYYTDDNNDSRLMSVDVSNGTLTANPVILDYFTELEADNYDFAMMAYHGTVGVTEVNGYAGLNIVVYPNPTSDETVIRLKTQDSRPKMITLYSLDGRVIWKDEIPTQTSVSYERRIDVSDLPEGVYVVRVMTGKQAAVGKVVVRD